MDMLVVAAMDLVTDSPLLESEINPNVDILHRECII
jgi:hypothetical protein